MMRYRNEHQESLYQQYASIGRKIEKYSQSKKNNELFHQYGWKLITKKGIWKLPIAKEHAGFGLTWQECFLAIEGLTSAFSNCEFFSYIVSQFGTLYLISQYASEENRQLYLPRLINGEISFAIFSEEINYENIFPSSKNRNLILCEYMNFKRILYGMQAIKITQPIIEKYKDILNQSTDGLSNSSSIINDIQRSHKVLYSSLKSYI